MERYLLIFTLTLISFHHQANALELQIIGIYSLCNGENHTEDEFTQFASAMELFINKDPWVMDWWYRYVYNHTTYKSFDVCYDHEKLTSVLIELLLNSTYYAINKSDSWVVTTRSRKDLLFNMTVTARRSTKIIRIITHIPQDMLQTLLDMMSIEKHIVVTVHSPLITTTDRMKNSVNFFNLQSQYGDFQRYLIKKRWENFLVLRTETNNDFYASSFNATVKILKDFKLCIKLHTVHNEERLRETIEKEFQSNQTNHLVVIDVGSPYGIGEYNLKENASYFKNIVDIDLFMRLTQVAPENFFPTFAKRQLIELIDFFRGTTLWMSDSKYSNRFKENKVLKLKMQQYRGTLKNLFYSTTELYVYKFKNSSFYLSDLLESIFGRLHFYFRADKVEEWNIPKNITSTCFHPICKEGEERVFGKIPQVKTHWDEEIGYFCQPCKQKFIKPSIGDDRCQKCPEYYASNEERTKCIDPLLPVHHKLTESPGIITLTVCIAGSILCILAIVIFIHYRQTPIVKLSDFTMSLIHLFAILSYFCSTPALYFLKPRKEMCMARTLSITLLYTLNISIIFTISNKLLKAFSTNIRSTKQEVLKTQFSQALMILICLLSVILLVGTFWSSQLPYLKVRIDIEKTQKILYCSNGLENVAVASLMLLLHLACFIQAFRCRKLPSHLNEAMSIVYGSFIATVSLCVMFPIYFSQKLIEDGELVILLILAGNTLILFLFMYAKKLFIIVFQPNKNTKQYFRMKHMEAMQIKARELRVKPDNECDSRTTKL